MEGPSCYGSSECDRSGLKLPVTSYPHGAGCSVAGGYVYRGHEVPGLRGLYMFGDYCSGTVWSLSADAPAPAKRDVVLRTHASIRSFGLDEAGELYVTKLSGGTLLRFVATN